MPSPVAVSVVSIRDIPYSFQTHGVYHSATTRVSGQRHLTSSTGRISRAIQHALQQPAAKHVWGIIVETDDQPMFVLQNTQYSLVPLVYRRVLRVREEYLDPNL
jgi:hypothetical protein